MQRLLAMAALSMSAMLFSAPAQAAPERSGEVLEARGGFRGADNDDKPRKPPKKPGPKGDTDGD